MHPLRVYYHALLIFGLLLTNTGAENLVIEAAGQVNVFLDDYGAPILAETKTKRGEFADAHVLPESWAELRYGDNETAVRVKRIQSGYGPCRFSFQSKDEVKSNGQVITLSPGTVQVTVRCPFPTMADLPLEELLQPAYRERIGKLLDHLEAGEEEGATRRSPTPCSFGLRSTRLYATS